MLGVNPTSALSTSRAKNLGKPSCLEEEAWVALKHVAPGVTFWGGGTNVSRQPKPLGQAKLVGMEFLL